MSTSDGQPGTQKLLASLGVFFAVVAAGGFAFGKSSYLVGGFLVMAVVLVLFAVFGPRMEGDQHIMLHGFKITLAKLEKVKKQADNELVAGKVVEAREVLDERQDLDE